MSSPESICLFKADTNRTQDYIFESNRLPDIRGGSRQLSWLNEEELTRLLDNQHIEQKNRIYIGGGNLLAILPDETIAQHLQTDIEALYPRETGVVTISTAYTSCHKNDLKDKNRFQAALRRLETRLNEAKRAPQIIPFFERLPFARPCQACGTRPAVGFDGRPGNESFPLCHICKKKLELGKERNYWNHDFFGDEKTVADLTELGSFSKGEIALLYADGDSFGDYMAEAGSPEDYRKRSEAIKKAIDKTIKGLEGLLSPNDKGVRPVEIITVGGDDILMLLPAKCAFKVAYHLISHFQLDKLSLSVGIAFGKDSTPVRLLFDTARMLLKEGAKRRRFEDKSAQGYIDFHDTTREGLISESLSRHRQQNQYLYKKLRMIGRPFSQAQFGHLLEQIPMIDMPASQLSSLSESLSQGKARSSLYYLYQRARDDRGYFDRLENLWHGDLEDYPWLPYTGQEAEHYTLLRDVVLMKKLGV